MASSPLHLPVGCGQRRYLQNTQNATSKSVLISFSDRLLFLLLVQICRISASFLFPLLLFQVAGGMTKGCRFVGAAGLLLPLEAVRRLRKERPAG
jgi:hypothetical protein